jgi:carotenoid 1,2-hydratase
MKIISDLKDDLWHNLGNNSYEWWYFDAISEDGYSLVITFFYGLPFSPFYNKKIANAKKNNSLTADPSEHVAIYFCLYGADKSISPLVYVLNEYSKDYSFSKTETLVKIGKSLLSYDSDKGFIIKLDALALWGREVKGELVFKPSFFPSISWPKSKSDHLWNCVAPRCKVSGELTITGLIKKRKILFQGLGYHDHNYGLRPMHEDIKRWHWGRLHTKELTAIYYIIESNSETEKNSNEQELFLAVLNDLGNPVYLGTANFQFEQKQDLMGVKYFSQINLTIESNNNLTLKVIKTRTVDQGPFYLRFLAEQELKLSEKEVIKEIGFAEAFEPAKLFVKAFWPFIKMPIRKFY